jgi:hypothetical protein
MNRKKQRVEYTAAPLPNQLTDGTVKFTENMKVNNIIFQKITTDIVKCLESISNHKIKCVLNWINTGVKLNSKELQLKVTCSNQQENLEFFYRLKGGNSGAASDKAWNDANILLLFQLNETNSNTFGVEQGFRGGGEILIQCSEAYDLENAELNLKVQMKKFVKEAISFNFKLLFTLKYSAQNIPTPTYLKENITRRFYYGKYDLRSEVKKYKELSIFFVDSLLPLFPDGGRASATETIENCDVLLFDYEGEKKIKPKQHNKMTTLCSTYRMYFESKFN